MNFIKKKLVCLLVASTFLSTLFAQKSKKAIVKKVQEVSFDDLDTAFARILKNHKVAGFSVAFIKKDKVIYSKGFGYHDVEKLLPASTNTSKV